MSDHDGAGDVASEELEPVEALEELLEEIADGLGLDVEVEVEEDDGVLIGRLKGEDVGLFIGRHGQTIDAVQHLAQRIVFPDGPAAVRIVIDANGYRERRAEALRSDADEAADEALRLGRAGGARPDATVGAADRPRVPARAWGRRDPQRGRRARAVPDRHAARGLGRQGVSRFS